jgi:YesN/AraC family two-component response regulator
MIVKSELENLGITYSMVELGEVLINEVPGVKKYNQLKAALLAHGLEILEDKKSILIEKIKNTIVESIHYSDEPLAVNFSVYLSEQLNLDYKYLSNLFSEVKGTTIEQYIIAHKIEHVKELLIYNELTLTEIADKLHYSSVAHLSNQFKKVTGLTPSYFKQLKDKRRFMHEDL